MREDGSVYPFPAVPLELVSVPRDLIDRKPGSKKKGKRLRPLGSRRLKAAKRAEWRTFVGVMSKVDALLSDPRRQIARSEPYPDVIVSTIFMSLDQSWAFDGKPVLFETMVFGGEFDMWQKRYCTYEDAKAGHAEAVEMVLRMKPKKGN